jgi:hypothetical protein
LARGREFIALFSWKLIRKLGKPGGTIAEPKFNQGMGVDVGSWTGQGMIRHLE